MPFVARQIVRELKGSKRVSTRAHSRGERREDPRPSKDEADGLGRAVPGKVFAGSNKHRESG